METVVEAPPITVEQFLGFEPPPGYRAELLDGKIIVSPEPKPIHQQIVFNICKTLDRLIGDEFAVNMRTNFNLSEIHYMPSPDVFVLPLQEWEQAIEDNRYPLGAPILAIEVISPANTEERVLQKTQIYLGHGAVQVWNVYPQQRSVIRCERSRQMELHEDGILTLPPPLPELKLRIAPFFQLRRTS
jgi:Uma2 family endonuclease